MIADAAVAVGYVAFEIARVPLRAAERLPGMGRLAVRRRGDPRPHAVATGRAARRRPAGARGRACDRSAAREHRARRRRPLLLENHVVERVALDLAETVDVDAVVVTALEHETTQQFVAAVIASRRPRPAARARATDRALRGPDLQRVIEHVAASDEVRAALTQQSATLAAEMARGSARGPSDSTRSPNGPCTDGFDRHTQPERRPDAGRGHRHARDRARHGCRLRQRDRAPDRWRWQPGRIAGRRSEAGVARGRRRGGGLGAGPRHVLHAVLGHHRPDAGDAADAAAGGDGEWHAAGASGAR